MELDCLREDPLVRRSAGLLDAQTDLVGQVDTLAAHERVILLDCVAGSGFEDGRIMVFSEEEIRHWARRSTGCHHLAPLETVDLLRTLFPDAGTRIDLVALCIDRLTWTPCWSVPTAAAEAVERVKDLLQPPSGCLWPTPSHVKHLLPSRRSRPRHARPASGGGISRFAGPARC